MVDNWLITSMGLAIGLVGAVSLNWFLDTEYSTGRLPLYHPPASVGKAMVAVCRRQEAAIDCR